MMDVWRPEKVPFIFTMEIPEIVPSVELHSEKNAQLKIANKKL